MAGRRNAKAGLALLFAAVATAGSLAATGLPAPQSDLDQFMELVLARRDENWKRLQQYILDEREQFELRGPLSVPIWGQRREYTWYIREGFFIRSPRTANGVAVSEEERREYEDDFLRRAKARDQEASKRGDRADGEKTPERQAGIEAAANMEAFLSQTSRPQFIDSAYFLKFKFEAGKYALVGRETFENREVLRIEYYPTRMFAKENEPDDEGAQERKPSRENGAGAAVGRLMNKVALITIWVEPATHQIVKYTFDNLHLDFLPAAWLVRLDDLRATMTMSQPFRDVWLPRDLEMQFGATMAAGSVTARYRIDYHDYREAATSGRIKSVVVP
jgi:hypothetical protein